MSFCFMYERFPDMLDTFVSESRSSDLTEHQHTVKSRLSS